MWNGVNETKAESHYKICFISNLVQDISFRIWSRGSGNLFVSLAKSFHCFVVSIIMSNKLLQISTAYTTIWQCTNVHISVEAGAVCFVMALLIIAKALSPKHHIDHDRYTYCIHNAYWVLHAVRKMTHKIPDVFFVLSSFSFSPLRLLTVSLCCVNNCTGVHDGWKSR